VTHDRKIEVENRRLTKSSGWMDFKTFYRLLRAIKNLIEIKQVWLQLVSRTVQGCLSWIFTNQSFGGYLPEQTIFFK
jgi:hypothetical protein